MKQTSLALVILGPSLLACSGAASDRPETVSTAEPADKKV